MRTFYCMVITKLTLVVLLGTVGCGQKTINKKYGAPKDMVVDAAFEVNYLNVHYYSLRTCLKCHDNRIEPNLGSYKDLTANIGSVLEEVTGGEMPPSADGYEPLNACQLLILNTWINSGMPKDGGVTLGAPGNACY